MKAVLQRVRRASVRVGGETVGAIERGFLVLVGAEVGDTPAAADEIARKVAGLRVFDDAAGKMNLALADVGGAVLAVSQFTLAADLSRGRRPGFEKALRGPEAQPLYERFVAALRGAGVRVETGRFGASMDVELVNEGPATFLIEASRANPDSESASG
ncbi:MAG TPA: D-aminoacyl-tRNA deacylase [Thermoanaerobaculia bacterium]|nr:D-aminoacyl-tRNA deacylase [Thermoanaerobaculia bacterium]